MSYRDSIVKTAHGARVRYDHGDNCAECRALGPGELEAIVRDLAATETPFDDLDCHLCGVYRYRTEERETVEVTIHEHETDCPWRLAVGWVSAHPVSGDPQ